MTTDSGNENALMKVTTTLDRAEEVYQSAVFGIKKDCSNLLGQLAPHVQNAQRTAIEISQFANGIVIANEDGLMIANQFLVDLAPCIKKVTKHKDNTTKDIKGVMKNIDGAFKGLQEVLEQADTVIRRKILQFRREQREAEEAVKEILQAEGQKVEQAVTQPSVSEVKTVRVDSGTVSYGEKWTFTVTDINKIPHEILLAAVQTARGKEALESVIRQRVNGGIRNIDGVEIKPEETTVVRGR